MTLLGATGLTKYFGSRLLFGNASFNIEDGEHVGLVGANGCGKTTLFKIFTEAESYDEGSFFINKLTRVGYMEQFSLSEEGLTAYDEVLKCFKPLMDIEDELEHIHSQIELAASPVEALVERQIFLHEEYDRLGGLTYKSRTRSALLGLGFGEDKISQSTATLSGGERAKVSLAKLLLSGADLLLLDEPTNHLDIPSVEWLEEFLRGFSGAFIVISHDRYFLDSITNRTILLENSRLQSFNGGYSAHLEQKSKNVEIQKRHYDNTMREIKRIEGIVAQQRQWNRERNIKTAESKLKQIARLEKTLVKPDSATDDLSFSFKIKNESGTEVLTADKLALSYGSKEIFDNVGILLRKRERVFLLGANGCGKTSLFKVLCGKQAGTAGMYWLGSQIDAGYYDQTQAGLNSLNTVLSEVWNAFPKMIETSVRSALAAFLFKGDEVYKSIGELSGGEKARISILKLMLSQANLLFLDEPTNHLDIASCEALEDALFGYEGTLFIISHDRYFINKLADRIYFMEDNGLTEYSGNYDEYIERKKSLSTQTQADAPAPVKVNEYKLKKEQQANERKRQTALKRTEENIILLEEELAKLEEALSSPEVSTDYEKVIDITKQIESKHRELEQLFEEWADLDS
ncbi:MAG: ATP-binding cassette domain-containing protein [Oscillospiraceae bacterium]|jgi:ATP-binding cassette subfamily F protein 3|nr:ATP-binding cassette domain-containing protein [Oscillospiraceae bacterium]